MVSVICLFITPQASYILSCLPFIFPEFIQILKRKPCIGKAVASLDYLSIQECLILKVDISKQAPIFIPLLPVVFKPYPFSFRHPLGKGRGLLSKECNRFFRVNGLRGIHSDKANPFLCTFHL